MEWRLQLLLIIQLVGNSRYPFASVVTLTLVGCPAFPKSPSGLLFIILYQYFLQLSLTVYLAQMIRQIPQYSLVRYVVSLWCTFYSVLIYALSTLNIIWKVP